MISKYNSAKNTLTKNLNIYHCPICHENLNYINKSLKCPNNHTFNLNKKGIVAFAQPISDKLYNNQLFLARRKILNSSLYLPIMKACVNLIDNKNLTILDVGCGEGSYLNYIKTKKTNNYYVGLDLAKSGLNLASDYLYINWLMADLANIPIKDQSVDIILNILSPANYDEFLRILKPNGMIIKIIPNEYYLAELRGDTNTYNNSQVLDLIYKNLDVIEETDITYQASVAENNEDLFLMTPLNYKKAFVKSLKKVSIDLKILVCKPRAASHITAL